MFRVKVSQHLSEETKVLIQNMFLFRVITFLEIIGFSFILSLIIIPFLHAKPNFFFVFLPVCSFVTLLYFSIFRTKQ